MRVWNLIIKRWQWLSLSLLFTIGCAQGPLGLSWGNESNSGVDSLSGVSLEASAMAIFQSACVNCHTKTSGPGGVFNVTDPEHLVSSGLVIPGQPDTSPIFVSVSNGSMPLSAPALSGDQLQTLRAWINSL